MNEKKTQIKLKHQQVNRTNRHTKKNRASDCVNFDDTHFQSHFTFGFRRRNTTSKFTQRKSGREKRE